MECGSDDNLISRVAVVFSKNSLGLGVSGVLKSYRFLLVLPEGPAGCFLVSQWLWVVKSKSYVGRMERWRMLCGLAAFIAGMDFLANISAFLISLGGVVNSWVCWGKG